MSSSSSALASLTSLCLALPGAQLPPVAPGVHVPLWKNHTSFLQRRLGKLLSCIVVVIVVNRKIRALNSRLFPYEERTWEGEKQW